MQFHDPCIGEIRTFAFPWEPPSFFACDGRILKIAIHTALFAYLGDKFGGDGKSTFALPKLSPMSSTGPYFFIAYTGQYPTRP